MTDEKPHKDELEQTGEPELLPPREVMSLLGGPSTTGLPLGILPNDADPTAVGGTGTPDSSSGTGTAQPLGGPADSAVSSALGQAQQQDSDGAQPQPTVTSESTT
jgi:hypothetical protein